MAKPLPGGGAPAINIRMHIKAHDILKTIASARGILLVDLLDQIAETYDPLVAPLREVNGHITIPTATE